MKTTQINVRDDQGGKVTVVESRCRHYRHQSSLTKITCQLQHIDSDNLAVFNPEVDAIDFWESLEGMRVQVGNVKAVAPQEHGDLDNRS